MRAYLTSLTSIFAIALLMTTFSSCRKHNREILTSYPIEVNNVYTDPSYEHSNVYNVLCLPIQNPHQSAGIELHRESLSSAIIRSVSKFNYFNIQFDPHIEEHAHTEVVDLTTGSVDRNLLGKLGKIYNCQAILKVSITDHSPFPPMKLRAKGSLVDTETAQIIWSFDQAFDTDDIAVIDSMRLWWNEHRSGSDVEGRFEISKVRPSFFYNFVFHKMAKTYALSRSRDILAYEKMKKEEAKALKKLRKSQSREKRGKKL